MAFDYLFRKAFWSLVGCGLMYALAMGALTLPVVQRNATYVHNMNPTYWQDLNNTEQFGFIHRQIQPFTVSSTENDVTLFAWHILPTHLYNKHEKALQEQPDFGLKPFEVASRSVGLQLLFNDPRATVVVAFHGNAAHLASNYRPSAYQQLLGVSTPEKPVHVIAFDYRGFGLSTGSPHEEGVIQDGVSVLSALTGHLEVEKAGCAKQKYLDPSQMILVGQSMGTFIATAVYHEWVIMLRRAPFKALVLIASFTSLPNLLESYSFKGLTPPILSPLMYCPKLQEWLRSSIQDKWEASSRLASIAATKLAHLKLVMLHARNDYEIPWQEGRANWEHALAAASNGKADFPRNLDNEEYKSADGKKHLRWERIRHGGHNRIQTSEQVRLSILRLLLDDE